ncbi:MAG: Hsp70 family protein [Deltaproteobacteria bacterium]|nr:Hsp70 family protein [Deltaproteobacteria bacterium]
MASDGPATPGPKVGGALRAHQRFDVDWRATVRCGDWPKVERIAAQNISGGGMFLKTQRRVAIGAKIQVTLELPGGDLIPMVATVRRIVDDPQGGETGIGVQVDEDHANELRAIAEIAQLRQQGPSEEDFPVDVDADDDFPAEPTGPIPPLEIASIIGVDFGVSYSGISVAVGDSVCMVRDDQGRATVPSIVHFPPEGGDPIVGWDARKMLPILPDRTVSSIKRVAGRKFDDRGVEGFIHSAAYRVGRGPNDAILIEVGDQQLAVPQVCAMILKKLREIAEQRLDFQIEGAVVTVPVNFGSDERNAIKRAAQIAGLGRIALIDEPVAAALAYGFGQGKNELVAVYDFGGGTFDFTVVDMSLDHYRVLVTAGDAWLGGDDFDSALGDAVANAFWRRTEVELKKRVVEWRRLLLACEKAKRTLSTETSVDMTVARVVESPKKLDLRQRIDRHALERICSNLARQSFEICKGALAKIDLEPRDITELVVTGGTSQIPFIREGLERLFERTITPTVSAEHAVALGAGLFAARLARHPARKVQSI